MLNAMKRLLLIVGACVLWNAASSESASAQSLKYLCNSFTPYTGGSSFGAHCQNADGNTYCGLSMTTVGDVHHIKLHISDYGTCGEEEVPWCHVESGDFSIDWPGNVRRYEGSFTGFTDGFIIHCYCGDD